MNYKTGNVNTIFVQQTKRQIHESMNPRGVDFRECRDSEAHSKSLPIILALDVTGSMGAIPRMLIADGLPKIMSNIIQRGAPDASLCFLAIGDHECDNYPVQIAQFESGDEELDMWLTRTYLEGGGGANVGESYPLAWEFAANRVKSDAWDKRKEKGFLFTIGDEPYLKSFPASALKEIYGDSCTQQGTLSAKELYDKACEKFNVYHISVEHNVYRKTDRDWIDLMGDNCIIIEDHNSIPDTIADIVNSRVDTIKETTEAPVML